MSPLHIVVERWWIRDGFCPPDYAWRAVISDPESELGITSAADASPWRAIARAGAYLALKRCGAHEPSQAQEELGALVERARQTVESYASVVCIRRPRQRASKAGSTRTKRASLAERRLL